MRVAISGVTGFIGLNLIEKLSSSNKHDIVGFARKESNIKLIPNMDSMSVKIIDYGNLNQVSRALDKVDVYIHLIGQMGGHGIPYQQFYDSNYSITETMLKACKEANVKQIIFCSTPGVQGFGKRYAKESDDYNPRNAYEQTKVLAEKFVIRFCKDSKMNYTIMRPDFVYGPGDVRRIKMYKSIQHKKFVLTTSGRSYLHPTYIEDIIQGFILAIGNEKAYNEIFNISAEEDITVENYLNTIADCLDTKVIHINIGYNISIYLANIISFLSEKMLKKEGIVSKNKIDFLALNHSTSNQKIKNILGYQAQYTCKEGLKETIDWCSKNNYL